MSEAHAITDVLVALARMRERFLTLASWLESEAHVVEVKSGVDTRCYNSTTYVECFVEAELDTGNAVCWWLDLRQIDDDWAIEPTTFVQHPGGQDTLFETPIRRVSTHQQFRKLLDEAVAELTRSPERALESALVWITRQ